MSKYQLLATDIDDTILAHNGSLPEPTRDALRSLHRAGVIIVFSSGRATGSMQRVVSKIIDLSDNEYLISYNGGRVSTALSDNCIFEDKLSSPLLTEIMEYLRKMKVHVQGYSGDSFILEKSADKGWTQNYARGTGMSYEIVDDLAKSLPNGSIKLLLMGKNEELRECQQGLMQFANDRFTTVFSRPTYLELVGPSVSKGKALTILAKHLGVELEHCIAFGDNNNDIEMLETAGCGVAVANAQDELKAVADRVLTRTSDESALLELMEHYFPHLLPTLPTG